MATEGLSIGDIARRAGCTVQIIRHYEKVGLLPEARRTGGNRRIYTEEQASRLVFIRHSRELGFSLDDIRQLLSFSDQPDQSCELVDALARKHLGNVQERLARLRSMERELKRMISQCGGGNVAECRIIEVLADHSKCLSNNHPTH
ncbi:MAG: helix-turn-helix domain-containing protein [Parvibaculaceae bacterium]|tara:strand:+ start:578 stop:1015 length:438 start_codon:yes stop_codon:yes gene_type:complete